MHPGPRQRATVPRVSCLQTCEFVGRHLWLSVVPHPAAGRGRCEHLPCPRQDGASYQAPPPPLYVAVTDEFTVPLWWNAFWWAWPARKSNQDRWPDFILGYAASLIYQLNHACSSNLLLRVTSWTRWYNVSILVCLWCHVLWICFENIINWHRPHHQVPNFKSEMWK